MYLTRWRTTNHITSENLSPSLITHSLIAHLLHILLLNPSLNHSLRSLNQSPIPTLSQSKSYINKPLSRIMMKVPSLVKRINESLYESPSLTISHSKSYINEPLSLITMRMEAPSLVKGINELHILDLIRAIGMFLQRLIMTTHEMNQRMTSLSITIKVPSLVKRFNE